jgi:transcriptional regulator with XRE-family HTH domain
MDQAMEGDARPDEEQVFYAELGARVRRARGQLPQHSLAEAVGLSRASVANIEAGRQPVSSWMLIRLAEALGLAALELLPTPEGATSDLQVNLRGLDASERRFVTAVSRKIEMTDAKT